MVFLIMANLELFLWCFFVSFIPNDYIFFSWPGDGFVHIFLAFSPPIFTSIFFDWVGTNHQLPIVDLDP